MPRPDYEALARLLEDALALPPEERARFVERCDADDALRNELSTLLAAERDASGYFHQLTENVVRPALSAISDETIEAIEPGMTVSHYGIIDKLGAGGMGVVYKAIDLRLGRHVAVKFLPPHLSADATAKSRFLAEAQSASALDHANIAVVHDIGETETGRLFIVMTYYEGETLDKKLRRGPLAAAEALDVARQIAGALSAAHARGIIHRDVKPSNILITPDGAAKLLDFGIAKLASSENTGPGRVLGTLAYMSPEQLSGAEVDQRTDLWSLGIVLYEMLTGRHPFRSDRDEALVHAIRHSEFLPPHRVNPDVPASAAAVVERCLAKERTDRYAQAGDLVADLEAVMAGGAPRAKRPRARLGILAGATALVIALAAGTMYVRQNEAPSPTSAGDSVRLAVLPPVNAGSDPADAYVAESVMTELVSQLSKISALRVTAPTSVRPYQAAGKSATAVGRELGVDTFLAGDVRKSAEGVRIALRLIDARTQQTLWNGSYAAEPGRLQAVHRDIAQQVIAALDVDLAPGEERRLRTAGTSNAEAYVLYLKGRHFLDKSSAETASQARDFFQQAIDLDPLFAEAWSGLGDAYHTLAITSPFPAAEAYPRMRAAAERALQINPELPDGHVTLGTALSFFYWDFEAAARHYRRAIALNPSHAGAHERYAEHLRYMGRFDEALSEARQAEALDPLSAAHRVEQGIILYLARRYDEAAAHFRRLLDANPRFTDAYFFLALIDVQRKNYSQALAALDRLGTEAWHAQTLRAHIHGVTGRPEEARRMLEKLQTLAPPRVASWHLAMIHLTLGEHDQALDMLEQAYRDRSWEARLLPVEPLFDPLRSHPRFIDLVEKMRGPAAARAGG